MILDFTDVAIEREVEGDLFHHDAGQGLYFKPGTFDGCVRCEFFSVEVSLFLIIDLIKIIVFLCPQHICSSVAL